MTEAKRGRSPVLVGLDIGTTKIACIVGERNGLGGIDVVGIGTHPSSGLSKGVVTNIQETVHSIRAAVEEAEMMAGVDIGTVYAGIAGGHVKSLNSEGVVAIGAGEVGQREVDKVLDTAQTLAIPADREVIHVIPQEYKIDEQEGIEDPRGMSGVRLTAKVHIVTAAVTAAQNIVRCCNLTGLNVRDIVLEQLASSSAVLTADEKELGVMLVDIGGGTTDLAIYKSGAVLHSHVLPVGGNHVTSDIAYGLRAPLKVAEQIKQKYGCALRSMVTSNEQFDVPSPGGDRVVPMNQQMLAEVIEPRIQELFELVRAELFRTGFEDSLPAGVVLTGGSSLLPGAVEAAEAGLGMQVRRGTPREVGGLSDVVASPIYATGVGLVKFGIENYRADNRFYGVEASLYRRMKGRVTDWLGKAL